VRHGTETLVLWTELVPLYQLLMVMDGSVFLIFPSYLCSFVPVFLFSCFSCVLLSPILNCYVSRLTIRILFNSFHFLFNFSELFVFLVFFFQYY